jgi:hypothetical protein
MKTMKGKQAEVVHGRRFDSVGGTRLGYKIAES